MRFTAEEIARFDNIMLAASCTEIFAFILIEAILLALILLCIFLPDRHLFQKRYHYPEPKKSKYRNGRKLSRRELDAEKEILKRKQRRKRKVFRISAAVLLSILFVFLIFVIDHQTKEFQNDMEQDAYVVYEGELSCEYHHSKHGSYYTFTFTDANGKTVTLTGDHSDYYGMDEGTYVGRAVYGQNSEYLIDLKLQ
ncbi:MAG: hypothetical protein E7645_04815 [Ruminococcaceae bacterium]|nr:hypothetical protein [Oscillospiraceae bacterium]